MKDIGKGALYVPHVLPTLEEKNLVYFVFKYQYKMHLNTPKVLMKLDELGKNSVMSHLVYNVDLMLVQRDF